MSLDGSAKVLRGGPVNSTHIREIQIIENLAFPAVEVTVRRGAGVEMICAVAAGELQNLSPFRQKGQIAVHGPQTDIRESPRIWV